MLALFYFTAFGHSHCMKGLSEFLKDFIYLFLERGEGREKEREGNIDV